MGWVLIFRALFLLADGSRAEAIAAAGEALRRSQLDRYAVLQAWAHWVCGAALASTEPETAASHLDKAARKAAALGMRPLLANVLWSQATLAPDPKSRDALARPARQLARDTGMNLWLPKSRGDVGGTSMGGVVYGDAA
jgi:hypothetical protein